MTPEEQKFDALCAATVEAMDLSQRLVLAHRVLLSIEVEARDLLIASLLKKEHGFVDGPWNKGLQTGPRRGRPPKPLDERA